MTPGDLNVAYSTQVGRYTKIGRLVVAQFSIVTSTFTHTTASGVMVIQTLPFASANVSGLQRPGSLYFNGVTKASYTQFAPYVDANTTNIIVGASGSGVAGSEITSGNMPTGGTIALHGTVIYEV